MAPVVHSPTQVKFKALSHEFKSKHCKAHPHLLTHVMREKVDWGRATDRTFGQLATTCLERIVGAIAPRCKPLQPQGGGRLSLMMNPSAQILGGEEHSLCMLVKHGKGLKDHHGLSCKSKGQYVMVLIGEDANGKALWEEAHRLVAWARDFVPEGYDAAVEQTKEAVKEWNDAEEIEEGTTYPCFHEHIVVHKCHMKGCVNPNHLVWGTQAENAQGRRERRRVGRRGGGTSTSRAGLRILVQPSKA
jgi:hypothetical protein